MNPDHWAAFKAFSASVTCCAALNWLLKVHTTCSQQRDIEQCHKNSQGSRASGFKSKKTKCTIEATLRNAKILTSSKWSFCRQRGLPPCAHLATLVNHIRLASRQETEEVCRNPKRLPQDAVAVCQQRKGEVVGLRPCSILLRRIAADAKHCSSHVCESAVFVPEGTCLLYNIRDVCKS